MKQKLTSFAGAMAVAGGVVAAAVAAATGPVSEVDHERSVSAPTPHTTVVFGRQLSDSDTAAPLGEWGAGRRTPRA
ncbi:hypothetical protein [Streptomyces sp. cmx-4-7]|uniref:hypothetical protein n=1 Tax=Streptomyces sp. cmx-4-7 TaxID=2790939 RepID=UPI0039809BBA